MGIKRWSNNCGDNSWKLICKCGEWEVPFCLDDIYTQKEAEEDAEICTDWRKVKGQWLCPVCAKEAD